MLGQYENQKQCKTSALIMPHDIAHHSMCKESPSVSYTGVEGSHMVCTKKKSSIASKKAIPLKLTASSIHYQRMHTLKELPLQMWKRGLWVNHRANQKECAQIWAFRLDSHL